MKPCLDNPLSSLTSYMLGNLKVDVVYSTLTTCNNTLRVLKNNLVVAQN